MSRIGKKPIKIPEGVNVTIGGEAIKVSGPLGNLERRLPGKIDVKTEDGFLKVSSKGDSSMDPIFGTTRSHVQNMLIGVSTGWSKTMELVGVGYRGELVGKNLSLALGFSHPVIFEAPNGITFKIEKSLIIVSGIDKDLVGLVADKIRAKKPPEPYKGKGIKYQNEKIRRKAGKAAKAQAGAA
ncbi:50S ribosomal protein L6 [Candidatus Woesebacteria bacterium RIFCSPLOWO2_01_FULL_39_23]|uniref:Large ribosomal subunit protein uL6 n=3 Tax=Microgenomates group TaxID=1794810 RepID=A0A0H4TEV8_9BACT|nr:50S ribosomal protein L6P, large subunit ribosomal protein L6 [uncultured Microgenomates bacterium Rifle_16ft_4_minimus_37633]AKQ05535.1 50S ribosomal protein L6P, large subunit ribosomal protein L6 [uncultured Microgenomates bacterium Rifle_16ft_4_minimus_24053]OGM13887.1 MAG: 50S ribosomal protein L6 [Candidatus Woesebacteria bacterium RBG_16_40_11]OGM27839.1 MAG: 50S ribosomal protein L6 [Candidatus Woesebacteria bacterium RIFCSPHIGHO2_01_FULL_40_22]OGM36302.1 MAG: 50S ribosomal protein L